MAINVGILGLGFMGQMHARCYQALPGVNLVAAADGQAEKRAQFEQEFGCVTYTNEPDLLYHLGLDMVDICLPTNLHKDAVVHACNAGKHVLCEKPMALSVAECDEMIAAAKQANVKFMVAHVIRFWPEYIAAKQLIDRGELGAVQYVEARRLSPRPNWSWQNWLMQGSRSGGGILDLHIHDIDFIRYLLGDPRQVYGAGKQSAGGAWDTITTSLTGFPGGATAAATGTLDLAAKFPFVMSLVVNCEQGTILLDSSRTPSLVVMKGDGGPDPVELPAPPVAKAEGLGNVSELGGYYNEIAYFTSCLSEGKDPEVVTARDAREAVRLCLASRQSAETGQVVAF